MKIPAIPPLSTDLIPTPQGDHGAVLQDDLASASSWLLSVVSGAVTYRPYFIGINGAQSATPITEYTDTDMRAIDPRLPEVFAALQSHSPGKVMGANIRNTLRLWNQELQPVPGGMLRDATCTHYAEADSFSLYSQSNEKDLQYLIVNFIGVETDVTKDGILYATTKSQPLMAIDTVWMDNNRTDWRKLLLLGESLALGGKARAKMVLFPSAQPVSAALPECGDLTSALPSAGPDKP